MATREDPRVVAAQAVLERLAPDGGPTVLVRDGLSLLVRRDEVLVRVRPSEGAPVAAREVAVARALASAGVPATVLVGDDAAADPQPWSVADQVVTAWRWERGPEGAPAPTAADLGTLARALHERTGAVARELPPFDPFGAVLGAVAALPEGDAQADRIRARVRELTPAWEHWCASPGHRRVAVHGDLHRDNVVVGEAGPVLTDLELAGSGPEGFDVAPVVVARRRYGAPAEDLAEFLEAYGSDPTGEAFFATFVAVYELWVTAWAVGVRDHSEQLAQEAARRVACLDAVDDCARWELL